MYDYNVTARNFLLKSSFLFSILPSHISVTSMFAVVVTISNRFICRCNQVFLNEIVTKALQ